MRELAASFAADTTLFEDHVPVLLPAAEDFTTEILNSLIQGRDGIIITMSYILHQDFMADGQAFEHIARTLKGREAGRHGANVVHSMLNLSSAHTRALVPTWR